MRTLGLLLWAALLPGCGAGYIAGVLVNNVLLGGPDVRFDTGDSDGDVDFPDTAIDTPEDCFDDPSVSIESAYYNCDEIGWWFDVYAVGLTGAATLHLAGPGGEPAEIGHEFWPTEPFSTAPTADPRGFYDDAGGCWDDPYLELFTATDVDDVVIGESTIFDCQEEGGMTFSVVVLDVYGAQADCASWGADPSGSFGGWDFGACEVL